MPDQPEPFDLRSHNLPEEKQQELLRLFPEIRTEGGQIRLRPAQTGPGRNGGCGPRALWHELARQGRMFQDHPGAQHGHAVARPAESVDFDTTENLIIEGDNLEVLKLLQKAYLGKVKMIYIDPPYNTGNDFIYPDNYTESLQTYLEYTGQVDDEGKKFGTNTEDSGRFHSRWLNMMYPRLYLARNLLNDDGVIFISIDDNENTNLKRFAMMFLVKKIILELLCGGGEHHRH